MSEEFGPGVWQLTNVRAATGNRGQEEPKLIALDLSAGDQQTIMGFQAAGNENQLWEFQPVGNGNFYIKNCKFGKYITFPDAPDNGKQVIATEGPREWEVRVGHEGSHHQDPRPSLRIFVPGTSQNLDLKDHGNTTDGNVIQLWEQTPGQNQAWYFERPQ